jgi:hypothetical protein
MATPEEIRDELEKKANRRINPLLKGLTMLTGGLAGEFTGTNEQIRERNKAKATLLEEQQREMQEGRIADRMRLQRQLMLEEDLKRAEEERQAAALNEARRLEGETMVARGEDKTAMGPFDPQTALGMARAKSAIAKAEYDRIRQLEGRRGEMTGYLSAQGVQTGEPDIETLAFLESQQKAKEEMKKAKKDLTMQLTTKSGSTVYGTYDELANRFPEEVKNISVAKEKPANISGRVVRDEFGKFVPVVDFGPGVTPQQVYDYTMEMNKQFGINPEGGAPEPGAGIPKAPAAAKGAPQVSRFGGGASARGGMTPAPSPAAMSAQTEQPMFGPFLMEEYNRTAKQLAAESGRVPYTRSTDPLMIPMYENIARELGVQPEQIGASRLSTRPYKVVESNLNQYLGQFGQLPQDVQNQAVMDALNQAMQKRRYREQEGVMYESPFNK